MSERFDEFITVTSSGANITTGAASANVAIPNTSAGTAPRYVRLASTVACYVKLGGNTVTAAAGDLMIQPADSVILQVPTGITYIAAIQEGSAGKLNISPLENI